MSGGEAAREETSRQVVYLLAMAVAIPLLVWWERKMSGPDAMTELRAVLPRPRPRAGRPSEDQALRELRRDIARFEGKVP